MLCPCAVQLCISLCCLCVCAVCVSSCVRLLHVCVCVCAALERWGKCWDALSVLQSESSSSSVSLHSLIAFGFGSVHANAAAHNIDPARVVVIGQSAVRS